MKASSFQATEWHIQLTLKSKKKPCLPTEETTTFEVCVFYDRSRVLTRCFLDCCSLPLLQGSRYRDMFCLCRRCRHFCRRNRRALASGRVSEGAASGCDVMTCRAWHAWLEPMFLAVRRCWPRFVALVVRTVRWRPSYSAAGVLGSCLSLSLRVTWVNRGCGIVILQMLLERMYHEIYFSSNVCFRFSITVLRCMYLTFAPRYWN